MENKEVESNSNWESIEIEKNPYYEYFKDFRIYSQNDHAYTYSLVQEFENCQEVFKNMEEKLKNIKYIIQVYYKNFQNLISLNSKKYYKKEIENEDEELESFEDIIGSINKEEDETSSEDIEFYIENNIITPLNRSTSFNREIINEIENIPSVDDDELSISDPEYDGYYDFFCYLMEKYLRKDHFDVFICFYHIPTEYYRLKIKLYKTYKLYEKVWEIMLGEEKKNSTINNTDTSTDHWITSKRVLENFDSENIPGTLKYVKDVLVNSMTKQENKRKKFLKWQRERMVKVNHQTLEELGQKFREKSFQETKIQQAQEDLSRLPFIQFKNEGERYERAMNLETLIYESKMEKLRLER